LDEITALYNDPAGLEGFQVFDKLLFRHSG
jgi:hypothetical protein